MLILELGINMFGEMSRLAACLDGLQAQQELVELAGQRCHVFAEVAGLLVGFLAGTHDQFALLDSGRGQRDKAIRCQPVAQTVSADAETDEDGHEGQAAQERYGDVQVSYTIPGSP